MALNAFFYASILYALIAQELSFFPLKQYMENNSVINTSMFLCHHRGSDFKFCNCDDSCFASKTCCIDKVCNNTNPLPLDIYLEMLVKKSNSYKDMVCEKIISVPIDSEQESGEILLVHFCQDGAETELTKLYIISYEHLYANNVPVKGSDNVDYRNTTCARGNFAEPTAKNLMFDCLLDSQPKKIQINATLLKVNRIFQEYKNCTVSLNKKTDTSDNISSCFSHVIEHCPTSTKHYALCKAYSGTFLNYKNYNCFKCFENESVVSNQNTISLQLSYIPMWLNSSLPLFHDTLKWVNYTTKWFNYTTAWFNDKKKRFNYTSVLFNYNQLWFNYSIVRFNITPVWSNFTSEWVNYTSLWSNYNLFLRNNKTELSTNITESFDNTKKKSYGPLIYFGNTTIVNLTQPLGNIIAPSVAVKDENFLSNTVSFIKTIQIKCGTGLYYNEVTKTCVSIICCYGYTVVGSECLDLQQKLPPIVINNASFENCLFSRKPGFYVISKNFQSLNYIRYILPGAVCFIIKKEDLSNLTLLQCNISVPVMKSLTNKKTIFYSLSSGSLIFFITSVYNQLNTELYNFNIGRSFTQNKLCAQPIEFTYTEGKFMSSCDYITENKTVKNEDLVLWIEIHDNEIKRKMSICKQFHLTSNCILQNPTNNYKIENQTLTYTYLNKEYRFNADQYVPLNKGVGICESTFLKLKNKNILDDAKNLLSVILLLVSMGCYLFIFTTYILFKELRIKSNLNLITLCAFLILSDFSIILAIFENKQKNMCKCISIILHWSLLAGYNFVLCMAIELTLKFWRFAPKLLGRTNSFVATIFISLMVPTIIVSINLVLDFTEAVYIGYGANNICWIGGFYARIFSYILPLFLILASSLLCLMLTIYNITKLESTNKKTLGEGKTSRVNLVMITMKLALILGVTDALGFFQISKPFLSEWEILFNSIFSLIYTCCRSSKGIMLFFVYICNKKVFRVYKRFTANTIIKWRKSLQNTIVIKDTSGFTDSTF